MAQSPVDPRYITYVWTVSVNGNIYVKNGPTPVKVGKLTAVSWTKKYKSVNLKKSVPAFKLLIATQESDYSQDVDTSMEMGRTETFVVQESLYRGSHFNRKNDPRKIYINKDVDGRFVEAQKRKNLGKSGICLKGWFSTEVAQTDDDTANSLVENEAKNFHPQRR